MYPVFDGKQSYKFGHKYCHRTPVSLDERFVHCKQQFP